MTCNHCGKPTKKPTSKFCSITCKNESQRGKREALNPEINVKCKIDGKTFEDYLNRSGILKKYSETTLNKPFDWEDWEQIKVETESRWKCPYCPESFKCNKLDSGGWIGRHLLEVHGMDKVEYVKSNPSESYLWPTKLSVESKTKEMLNDLRKQVKCLECGELFSKISNTHLMNKHNMTTEQYKRKYPDAIIISEEQSNILKGK